MKKLVFSIALITILASILILTGCNRVLLSEKNGPLTTQDYPFTDFTGIEVGHAFKVDITYSDTYKVTITASKSVLDRIDVKKTGRTLVIDMDAWVFSWHSTPKVAITMPSLQKLDLSGASEGNIRGFRSSDKFDLTVSGASELNLDMETGGFKANVSGASRVLGYLKASDSNIELSGASEIKLTGTGGNIVLSGSGASHSALQDYPVNDADIDFSGASSGSLNVSGKLDASLSGASSLEYYGNPTMGSLDISGASDIDHKTAP